MRHQIYPFPIAGELLARSKTELGGGVARSLAASAVSNVCRGHQKIAHASRGLLRYFTRAPWVRHYFLFRIRLRMLMSTQRSAWTLAHSCLQDTRAEFAKRTSSSGNDFAI